MDTFRVNNNGYLYSDYSLWLSPFQSDSDTRGSDSGLVWHKYVGNTKVAVAWDHIDKYSYLQNSGLHNTFQVVLSDGTDPTMGLGNNACFCYNDMDWTASDAFTGGNTSVYTIHTVSFASEAPSMMAPAALMTGRIT